MMDKYPRGKLCDDDEGACYITVFDRDKTVIIDFGKELKWIGIDSIAAKKLALSILNCAEEIENR